MVVSLFVNPTQFNDVADLAGYPRDERRDFALASELGVDHLFAPRVEEVYPEGFATTVSVRAATDLLEGAHRGRGHFDGITTVVAKLLGMVQPDVAYFGRKDAQQVFVIKQLVRDLDIPTQIETCPTVRDPDGLALSSRNVQLSSAERARATAIHRSLRAVQAAVAEGEQDPVAATARGRAVLAEAGIEPDYLELVSNESFTPVDVVDRDVLAVVAARVGTTRLIDNELIHVLPAAGSVDVLSAHQLSGPVAAAGTDLGRT